MGAAATPARATACTAVGVPSKPRSGCGLQGYAVELEEATRVALAQAAPRRPGDPDPGGTATAPQAPRGAASKNQRLLDAYTDGVLTLTEYKARREAVQQEVETAQTRLRDLDRPEPTAPSARTVGAFADLWPALSVEARRDVASALLRAVQIRRDKTVLLVPRWGSSTMVTFSGRGQVPSLQPSPPQTP